jgi:hypothetical protein
MGRDRSVVLHLGIAQTKNRWRLLHDQPAGRLDRAVRTNHVAHDAPLELLGRCRRQLDLRGEDAIPGHPVSIPTLVVHRQGLPSVPTRIGLPGLGVERPLQADVADLGCLASVELEGHRPRVLRALGGRADLDAVPGTV